MSMLLAAGIIEVNPGLIIWTLVTFVLVLFILRRLAWDPMLKLIEDRERAIVDAIESAKKERSEAERLLAEQKNAISDARREAAEMMRKNKDEVDKFRDELMAKSKKEADELVTVARRQINDEKTKAISEVRTLAVDLALDAAAKLIGSSLDDAKQKQLVKEYIEKMPTAAPKN
jgi:F-type H+-transporting ATPase subunit b